MSVFDVEILVLIEPTVEPKSIAYFFVDNSVVLLTQTSITYVVFCFCFQFLFVLQLSLIVM